MSKSIGIKCPKCGSRMHVNGVKQPSPMLKQMIATCSNPKCLCSVNAHLEVTKILHRSLIDVPEITQSQAATQAELTY